MPSAVRLSQGSQVVQVLIPMKHMNLSYEEIESRSTEYANAVADLFSSFLNEQDIHL